MFVGLVDGSEEMLGNCVGYFLKCISLDVGPSIFLKGDEMLSTDNSDDRWVSLNTIDNW